MRCPRARCSQVFATPRPGISADGAMSTSGRNTNARSCMRGCGKVRCGRDNRRRPNSSRSRSSTRAALRREGSPAASLSPLDCVHASQQRRWRERGAQLGHGVDVVGLRLGTVHRGADVVVRSRHEARSRQPRERRERARKAPPRMPEIAAEPDEGDVSHSRWSPRRRSRRVRQFRPVHCSRRPRLRLRPRARLRFFGASSGRSIASRSAMSAC